MSVRHRAGERYCFGVAVLPRGRERSDRDRPGPRPGRRPPPLPTTEDEASGADAHRPTASERPSEPALGELLPSVNPRPGVVLLVAAYTAYFTNRTLDIHHGLGTASYDSALYDQGVWLLSRFHTPFVTLMGRNLFGDHTSFILLFLVPIYWVVPSAGVLFFSSRWRSVRGRSRSTSSREASVVRLAGRPFAAVYLLHPAVSWSNMENFHPDSYLGVLVGFAIYGAVERGGVCTRSSWGSRCWSRKTCRSSSCRWASGSRSSVAPVRPRDGARSVAFMLVAMLV